MIKPLTGIRVLDFTTLLPGPFATKYLADMGATITRIEAPDKPDLLKALPPLVSINGATMGASYAYLNGDKSVLKLNLKSPEAVAHIQAMINDIDVVIEGFRPGVMARLNLSYPQLKAINPRLIYCALTGYGQTGPLKDTPGHDINYVSVSGLAGYSGSTKPELSSVQIADLAAGSLHAVIGIQAAIIERARTQKGHFVDSSMADCCTAFHAISGANHRVNGIDPTFGSELLNGGSFYDYYETQDGRWLSVGGLEPKFVFEFCRIIGHPEWTERFFDFANPKDLKKDLTALFLSHPMTHWTQLFDGKDACVEPVLKLSEVVQHPHFVARGLVKDGAFVHPIQYDTLS